MMRKAFFLIAGIGIAFICGIFLFKTPLLVEVSFSDKATYQVEIADTQEKAEMGLMYRKSMPKNQGMLFIFPRPKIVHMWMKNTYIPLDMIFINSHNQVICLRENTRPLDESIISCPYPASKVLELNAGEIKASKIQPGDTLFIK